MTAITTCVHPKGVGIIKNGNGLISVCMNYEAIRAINRKESGKFAVYTGWNGIKLDKEYVADGWFVTYVSTTWKKKVAEEFVGLNNEGMIIEIYDAYKFDSATCCDVSWISKFPDECEVLFARDRRCNASFHLMVTDDIPKGIQTISLSIGENIGYNWNEIESLFLENITLTVSFRILHWSAHNVSNHIFYI